MKTTVEKLENDRVSLEVEVDTQEVESALDRAYRKVVKTVNLPGFRKGRVPRPVLERHFGVEVLYEDALDELLPKAYSEAVDEAKIEPIDQPEIDVIEFAAGKPFRFTAEVQVKPEVKLGEYKGVEVKRVRERVTDQQVDEVLEQYRQSQAQLVVAERDTVESGDFATIDFEGFVDGKPFQGGAGKDYQLEIGSGQFIPGFEDQLVGAKVGTETEVNVTFPTEYHHDELAGAEAVFKVTVSEIKVKELPELDDEFAKDVSDKDTLAELRAMIRENLETEANRRADERLRNAVVEAVAERAEVNIPEVLIERERDSIAQDFMRDLQFSGIDPNAYLQQNDMTIDSLKEEFSPQAEQRAKGALVLEAISKAENITVSDEDVDARIEEMAGPESDENKDYRQRLNQPEMRDRLSSTLQITKTIDLLIEQAKITEEEVDPGTGDDEATEVDTSEEEAQANEV